MKIVADIKDGHLVEMTTDEIARCAGFQSAWSWKRQVERDPASPFVKGEEFRLGTVIDFRANYTYLDKLRENENQVRGQAKLLRAMADMLDSAMPTTMIPPEEPLEGPK